MTVFMSLGLTLLSGEASFDAIWTEAAIAPNTVSFLILGFCGRRIGGGGLGNTNESGAAIRPLSNRRCPPLAPTAPAPGRGRFLTVLVRKLLCRGFG